MRKIIFLIFVFVEAMADTVNAQIFTQVIDEQELQFKVKQIDEFFRRFNYETDYKDESVAAQVDSVSVDSVMKRKNLMTILNLDSFMDKNKALDSIAAGFLDYVINNGKQIHYTDTTWYAEAVSSLIMSGKSYPIRIFLQTEHVKDVTYKWVITGVETPIFSSLTDSLKLQISILPNAHGTAFMALPGFVNLNAQSVQSLFCKDYKPNMLTVFAYLISTGKIKLQSVTKVIYHFQLDDYKFTVERFEKAKSYNKGWLISKIIKN